MNEPENLETLAANEAEVDTSTDSLQDEVMGGEAPAEAETQKGEPKDEEKEALKAQVQRLNDQRNGVSADFNVIAKVLKGFMDEYGVGYDEAAKIAGIEPNDLKARVENLKTANPVQAFSAAFDDLYVGKGGKAVLDDVYGADTQPFVRAFADYGLSDPELREQVLAMEPAKALNFVVKHGKELMDDMGGQAKSLRQMAKENAALKAEIATLKASKGNENGDVQPKQKLPLSGAPGLSTVSKPVDGVEARFYG